MHVIYHLSSFLFAIIYVALSERGGYIIAAREGEVPGMGLVVLVSPDLEECSIPRQWVKKFASFLLVDPFITLTN